MTWDRLDNLAWERGWDISQDDEFVKASHPFGQHLAVVILDDGPEAEQAARDLMADEIAKRA